MFARTRPYKSTAPVPLIKLSSGPGSLYVLHRLHLSKDSRKRTRLCVQRNDNAARTILLFELRKIFRMRGGALRVFVVYESL